MVVIDLQLGSIPCCSNSRLMRMGSVSYHGSLTYCCQLRIISSSSQVSVASRRQVLEQVDKELSKGDERAAVSLVKDLQGKPGGLRCFGTARQVQNAVFLPVK